MKTGSPCLLSVKTKYILIENVNMSAYDAERSELITQSWGHLK